MISLLIGKNNYWGNLKWIVPVVFGIMHMLAEYATFSISNMIANSFTKINVPHYELILIGAVYEVAKYPVKATDFLNGSDKDNRIIVDDLEKALSRKRLIAFGGLLKVIQKELNMTDAEDEKADLIHTCEEIDGEETEKEIIATWDKQRKNYFIS